MNGRPVKSQPVSSALRRGYGELLPAGRFPLGILYVTVPTDQVDVNVHPTKREVKFKEERALLQMIVQTVRKVLDRANLFKKIDLPVSRPRVNRPPHRRATGVSGAGGAGPGREPGLGPLGPEDPTRPITQDPKNSANPLPLTRMEGSPRSADAC